MKKFLVGIVLGFCLPFAAAYFFVSSGRMPVATKGPPLPFEKAIARKALHAVMDPEVGHPSPLPANEGNYQAGARVYQTQCAVCHGRLGQSESAIARGMFPHPPQLLPPRKGVTDDLVGETYWKARHGIRLTGMPGYESSLTDTELWQVSLMLRDADKLPASVLAILRQ
ncbi:MAG: c-type cytochrome [Opitutales bacterium]